MLINPIFPKDLPVRQEKSRLEKLARENDLFALETLGCYLLRGKDYYDRKFPHDPKRGLELLSKAADAGYGVALSIVIDCYGEPGSDYYDQNKAEHYCDILIEGGDPYSLVIKGRLLRDNRGAYEEALRCFERAHDKHNADGTYELACMYIRGLGTECDFEKAHELLSPYFDERPEFLTLLGEGYLKPEKRDIGKALEYFEKAVQKEDAAAGAHIALLWLFCTKIKRPDNYLSLIKEYLELGTFNGSGLPFYVKALMYEKGIGRTKNPDWAFDLLDMARERGCLPAEIRLAAMLCDVDPGTVDEAEEMRINEYIESAVEKGIRLNCGEAYNLKGLFYERGRFVEQDLKKAYECFLKAGQLGDGCGYYNCARHHLDGIGRPCDETAARAFFKKAMDLDCIEAFTEFGRYLTGSFIQAEVKEGLSYLRTAARYNDDQAMDILGDYCSKERPGLTTGHLRTAAHYYYLSSRTGNKAAAYNFALCLLKAYSADAIGIRSVAKKILHALEKGARRKIPEACTLLGKIYLAGKNLTKPDPKKAFELFSRGADLGDIEAHLALAYCYQNGIGTAPSLPKAREEAEKCEQFVAGLSPEERADYADLLKQGPEGAALNLPKGPGSGGEKAEKKEDKKAKSRIECDRGQGFVITSDVTQ